MKLTGYEKELNKYNRTELINIASNYMIGGSKIGFSRLTKQQLIEKISNDQDYINANPDNKFVKKTKPKVGGFLTIQKAKLQASFEKNRISPIVLNLIGTENPDDLMNDIIMALQGSETYSPIPGNYYTYIYYAKTPGIYYDVHPLVEIDKVTKFGFQGFNYHWQEIRKYTWPELPGPLYEISSGEYSLLQQIPYKKIVYRPS
jgi:hypothetical protein